MTSFTVTGSGLSPYMLTGSGPVPLVFEDGIQAHEKYGVPVRYGSSCPRCSFPAKVTLAFNPCDGHYYYQCPGCQRWFRYLNPDGSLSDFAVVRTNKTTPTDEELGLSELSDIWRN